ncbi:MAG: proton-conducting transporter membrane subunit [Chromatiaceae bacterium]
MTATLLLIVLLAPLTAVLAILAIRRARVAEALNLAASLLVCAAALPLPWLSLRTTAPYWAGYVLLDPLGAWVLVCTALVYLLASMYAIGYMRLLGEERRLYRFYALFAGFALTMLAAPVMNNVGVYWITVELTTLVSTFLVGFERGRDSIEAAWKYIVIVSAGISLALLGTMVFYWAGSLVLGPSYDMTWAALREAAPRLDAVLATLALFLVLIGYGTKVGLAPMHTWLPDAHSEGPAPVSAMLSGALLNTAMLGIVRFIGIADAARLGAQLRAALVVLGLVSVAVAALFIVRQQDVKRLMAYSSVEHMGVLALGFGFGGPLGIAGALYHMANHSLNKSLMFFGAGVVMRGYGTKDMGSIRAVLRYEPTAGALWLAGAVAITGAPPFALFLSEVTILRAGWAGGNAWAVVALALLLIVVFIGFMNHVQQMYFADVGSAGAPRARCSTWCLLPMWLALIPVLVLGLWWPEGLWHYFAVVSAQIGAGAP